MTISQTEQAICISEAEQRDMKTLRRLVLFPLQTLFLSRAISPASLIQLPSHQIVLSSLWSMPPPSSFTACRSYPSNSLFFLLCSPHRALCQAITSQLSMRSNVQHFIYIKSFCFLLRQRAIYLFLLISPIIIIFHKWAKSVLHN